MMKKKADITLIVTTIICLIPAILAVLVFDKLPMQVPIHFDNAGNPDNFLPKAAAAFGLPALMAAINLYTHFRLNKDPKAENASSALKQAAKWMLPVISIVFIPFSLFIAMEAKLPIVMVAAALVGVIIVICGNYLPKCRQNYTVGIKLPWTLDSEKNWNKTHRFAGFVWTLGGLVIMVNSFFTIWYVGVSVIIVLVTSPVVYSYFTYKAAKKRSVIQ